MPSIYNAQDRAALLARLDGVTPSSSAAWGRMNAGQMVAHLIQSLRMALGEVECAPKGGPLSFPPLRWLVVHLLPFPKGVPSSPELLRRTPSAELESDRDTLRALLERFAANGPGATFPRHPAFGVMKGRQWGILVYRHTDHHLRQFGV